jgi:hypothetical protein
MNADQKNASPIWENPQPVNMMIWRTHVVFVKYVISITKYPNRKKMMAMMT